MQISPHQLFIVFFFCISEHSWYQIGFKRYLYTWQEHMLKKLLLELTTLLL